MHVLPLFNQIKLRHYLIKQNGVFMKNKPAFKDYYNPTYEVHITCSLRSIYPVKVTFKQGAKPSTENQMFSV